MRIMISETAVHSHHGYLLVWVMHGFIIKLRTYIPITARQAVKFIQLQRQNTKTTAWSTGAGVKYDVTQDFSLDLSYRYLDAGDSTLTYKDEDGAKYKSSVDVRSNEFMLGATYNF